MKGVNLIDSVLVDVIRNAYLLVCFSPEQTPNTEALDVNL